MTQREPLTPVDERIEEIRAIRQKLYAPFGEDYARLRELGNRIPPGFRVLREVRPIIPLSDQIDRFGSE